MYSMTKWGHDAAKCRISVSAMDNMLLILFFVRTTTTMSAQVASETKSATGNTAMEDFAVARETMPFERQNGWNTAGVGSVGPGGGNEQFSREQLAQLSSDDRKRIIAEYEVGRNSTLYCGISPT